MPTACSPRNYASCTSMIGGRLRSVQIPAEGSDSHPFATCVCPIPVSVFHFPFSPYTVPPLSTKNPVTSLPFPPLHLLCPVILSSISALPCIVRLSSSTVACHTLLVPSHFPHYNVRARVWVWKCCKFCKFASFIPALYHKGN